MRCYRFDLRDFNVGEKVLPDSKAQPEITDNRRPIEKALCGASKKICSIRSSALYCYESYEFAVSIQKLSQRPGANVYKGRKLYEIDIRDEHILHKGDLSTYEAIGKAIAAQMCPAYLVEEYIAGKANSTSRRFFEVLASEGTVVKHL
jgi:hypothetical protein